MSLGWHKKKVSSDSTAAAATESEIHNSPLGNPTSHFVYGGPPRTCQCVGNTGLLCAVRRNVSEGHVMVIISLEGPRLRQRLCSGLSITFLCHNSLNLDMGFILIKLNYTVSTYFWVINVCELFSLENIHHSAAKSLLNVIITLMASWINYLIASKKCF